MMDLLSLLMILNMPGKKFYPLILKLFASFFILSKMLKKLKKVNFA